MNNVKDMVSSFRKAAKQGHSKGSNLDFKDLVRFAMALNRIGPCASMSSMSSDRCGIVYNDPVNYRP